MISTIYLVPSVLDENATQTIPSYIIDSVKKCQVIFAENERTTRRFLKSICKEIVIDEYEWFTIHKAEEEQKEQFRKKITEGKNIAIISEAGCPGIADPGAELVAVAHQLGAKVIPLTGPNSLVLELMASGLNGQSFAFNGYLPVKEPMRGQKLKELEARSVRENQTQLFIETPYRNESMLADLIKNCNPKTRICIAQNITAPDAFIYTKIAGEWEKNKPVLGKVPAVFLMLG